MDDYQTTSQKQYELTDIGDVHHILGMRVTRQNINNDSNNNNNINYNVTFIDQQTYINSKLSQFNMGESKETSTPGDVNVLLNDSSEKADANLYRSIVGSLIYASTSTRPDITHAVNIASRVMHAPTQTHMRAAKKVLRYLAGCDSYALKYTNNNNNNNQHNNSSNDRDNNINNNGIELVAYCDADWGGDKADRKSTTGYCVYMNDNLISWNTKKQVTVALSTAEAELMAIVEAVKEVKWMSQLLTEMNVNVKMPISIYTDNQAAIKIAQHDIEHDRTKHIDIKYHFIRDEINNKQVAINWIRTERQVADVFTKTLSSPSFINHRNRLVHERTVTTDSNGN